jgi:hypothetical protein
MPAKYDNEKVIKRRSKVSILHDEGSLCRDIPFTAVRKTAFERQKERICAQVALIEKAGYDPDNDSVGMIERAGIL